MAETTSDFDSILESVEEFLIDENKIVTYEWLSQSVGIHVNLAKSVLEKYAENWKKKKERDPLSVIYNVGGYVGKNLRIVLTPEECLPKAKLDFDKLLFTHIFSIQQNKLTSLELLFNANSTGIKRTLERCNRFSAINCSAVEKRKLNQESITEVKTTDSFTRIQKAPKVEEAATETAESKNLENKDPEIKTTASKPMGKKVTETPAIAAFFAKHQVKNKPAVEKVEKVETVPIKANPSTKRLVREPSDDDEDKTPVNCKRLKLVEGEKSASSTKLKAKQKASKKTTKSKEPAKKRKRIQAVSESESESSDEEEQAEDVLDSPERPPPVSELDEEDFIPLTPNTNILNKSKKLVTKQHLDKNGFLVTSKEFVMCTNDAEDKDVPIAEQKEPDAVKTEVPKPISPPMKKKQPSITNFFTRK